MVVVVVGAAVDVVVDVGAAVESAESPESEVHEPIRTVNAMSRRIDLSGLVTAVCLSDFILDRLVIGRAQGDRE